MERALRRAEDTPGRDPRPAPGPGDALLGPDRDDAARRRPPSAAQQLTTLDRIAHEKFVSDEIGALLEDLAGYEQQLDYDSDDASPDPHDAPRLRQVAPRPGRAGRRDDRRGRRGARRLGEGARGQRLRALPPPPRARGRAEAPLHRLLRGLRRAVRRPPRRLRAGDEDGRGARGLRRPEGRARAADRRDRLGRRRRRVHVRPVADRRAARVLARDHQALRLRRVVRPARPDRAPVRGQLGHPGHPPDDALQGGRHHSIFTAMHECGHGLYEHGVSPSLERTPLCHGVSSALHESQSRMWENIVGRSREFWNHFYPSFQEAFPEAVGDVDQERFYRAINRVKPSYIRVDADEATYNLHIILRFELEQEIFAGTIELKDLPGELEPPLRGVPRDPGAERHARRAPGRALVGRRLRLLPHLLARQHRLRADLGEGARPSCPTCPTSSSRASSASCTSGCRRGSTRSGASSRRRRRSSASSAARSTRRRTSAT